jgi:hypothetical protein
MKLSVQHIQHDATATSGGHYNRHATSVENTLRAVHEQDYWVSLKSSPVAATLIC